MNAGLLYYNKRHIIFVSKANTSKHNYRAEVTSETVHYYNVLNNISYKRAILFVRKSDALSEYENH